MVLRTRSSAKVLRRPLAFDSAPVSGVHVPGHDDVGELAQGIGHRLHLVGRLSLMTRAPYTVTKRDQQAIESTARIDIDLYNYR
jgi:hypothetical protein